MIFQFGLRNPGLYLKSRPIQGPLRFKTSHPDPDPDCGPGLGFELLLMRKRERRRAAE